MKKHTIKNNKYVVIVDPFSTGAVLAGELNKRGYKSISVLSKNKIPDVFSTSYQREDFSFELRFDNNIDEILYILGKFNIKAVISCLETSVSIADTIGFELGLPCNNYKTSDLRRDKYLMGEAVRNYGLRAVKQQISSTKDGIYSWLEEHKKYPVVIKPVKSAGSDGVTICHNLAEVELAYNNIFGIKNKLEEDNTSILIQEFLDGDEYVVDTVSLDGCTVTTNVFVYEKTRANGADFVYRAIRAIDNSSPIAQRLIEYNDEVLKAVGITQGAGHSEIIVMDDEPCLVEVGARLHGGNIPSVVQKCAPWSQIELLIDSYLNRDDFFKKSEIGLRLDKNILIHFYISNKDGEISQINNKDEISNLPSFFDSIWYKNIGCYLNKTTDLYTCPLKVILADADETVILKDRDKLISMELSEEIFILN